MGDRRGRAKETPVIRRGNFPRLFNPVEPLRCIARVAGRGNINDRDRASGRVQKASVSHSKNRDSWLRSSVR